VLCLSRDFEAVQKALNHKYLSTTLGYLVDGVLWAIGQTYSNFLGIEPVFGE